MTKEEQIEFEKESKEGAEELARAEGVARSLFGEQCTPAGVFSIYKLLVEADDEQDLAAYLKRSHDIAAKVFSTVTPTVEMVLGTHEALFYRSAYDQLDDIEDALEELGTKKK